MGITMFSSNCIEIYRKLEEPRFTNHNSKNKFTDILVMAFVASVWLCRLGGNC